MHQRYQGRCLDGKRLGPELELVGLMMSLGSWLGKCSETAVRRFQGAMHCAHAVQLLLDGMVDYDPAIAFFTQESEGDYLSPCRVSGFILN